MVKKRSAKKEIWVCIPGYRKQYMVSNKGKIKSLGRTIRNQHNSFYKKEKILTPIHSNGYLTIKLCVDGRTKTHKIHRLVMMSFKGRSALPVDHRNGRKKDNRLSNLRYCTHRKNTIWHHSKTKRSSSHIGVTFDKKTGKWRAQTRTFGVKKSLGYFNSQIKARKAYLNYERKIKK
jgi:hypothetical protein